MQRSLRYLLAGSAVALLACVAISPSEASARRHATRAEARAIWRDAERWLRSISTERQHDCLHRRPFVSTVAHKRFRRHRFGVATVGDRYCGDGSMVVRKRRHRRGHWKMIGSDSDWGAPDRCADDLDHIPVRVLRDLFAYPLCAEASVASARVCARPAGGSIYRLRSTRVACRTARRVAAPCALPGTRCHAAGHRWSCSSHRPQGGRDARVASEGVYVVSCHRGRRKVRWDFVAGG